MVHAAGRGGVRKLLLRARKQAHFLIVLMLRVMAKTMRHDYDVDSLEYDDDGCGGEGDGEDDVRR